MAPNHSPGFLKIVEDAKQRIRETTVDEVKARLDRHEQFVIVDVREESEFAKDHLPGAIHLGKETAKMAVADGEPEPLTLWMRAQPIVDDAGW